MPQLRWYHCTMVEKLSYSPGQFFFCFSNKIFQQESSHHIVSNLEFFQLFIIDQLKECLIFEAEINSEQGALTYDVRFLGY